MLFLLEVCAGEPPWEGELQGGGGDDRHRGQEWGQQDQLLRVQSNDGRIPTCYSGQEIEMMKYTVEVILLY